MEVPGEGGTYAMRSTYPGMRKSYCYIHRGTENEFHERTESEGFPKRIPCRYFLGQLVKKINNNIVNYSGEVSVNRNVDILPTDTISIKDEKSQYTIYTVTTRSSALSGNGVETIIYLE